MKKFVTAAVAFVAALTLALAPLNAASAADSQYRYWSFWQAENSTWSLAQVGMMSIPAEDGLVLGWRFVTSGVNASSDLAPRKPADFATLCAAAEEAAAGEVTIAIVIDYGDATDYADGTEPQEARSECVSVEAGSPSSLALASMAEIRENAGFVCALDNLPAEGCGEEVTAPLTLGAGAPESTQPAVDESEQMWDTVATIVTTVLGVVVFVMAWRRMMLQKANKRKQLEDNE